MRHSWLGKRKKSLISRPQKCFIKLASVGSLTVPRIAEHPCYYAVFSLQSVESKVVDVEIFTSRLQSDWWLGGSIRHTPSHCTAINRADISIQLRSGQVSGKRSDQLTELYRVVLLLETRCVKSLPGWRGLVLISFLSFNLKSNSGQLTGKTLSDCTAAEPPGQRMMTW